MNCINMKQLVFLFIISCNIACSQTPKMYEVKVQTKGGVRSTRYVTATSSRQARLIVTESNRNDYCRFNKKNIVTIRKVSK